MTFLFYHIAAQEDKCKGTNSQGNVIELIMTSLLFNFYNVGSSETARK